MHRNVKPKQSDGDCANEVLNDYGMMNDEWWMMNDSWYRVTQTGITVGRFEYIDI